MIVAQNARSFTPKHIWQGTPIMHRVQSSIWLKHVWNTRGFFSFEMTDTRSGETETRPQFYAGNSPSVIWYQTWFRGISTSSCTALNTNSKVCVFPINKFTSVLTTIHPVLLKSLSLLRTQNTYKHILWLHYQLTSQRLTGHIQSLIAVVHIMCICIFFLHSCWLPYVCVSMSTPLFWLHTSHILSHTHASGVQGLLIQIRAWTGHLEIWQTSD